MTAPPGSEALDVSTAGVRFGTPAVVSLARG
jgi:hypothetical protein